MKAKQEETRIVIPNIDKRMTMITIKSLPGSTYISHRLADEAVAGFMGREEGKPTKAKKIRNYDEEYESCFYYTEDEKYGAPSGAIMSAMLYTAMACDIPKTQIKRAIRVLGDIYELRYTKLNRRVDHPRRGGINKTPDTRHRPEFIDWECDVCIQYDANQITEQQIVNLLDQAGFSSGIGDWRPSSPKSSGSHGMFEVKKG